MDFVHLLIYDIRAELHQLVDDTADGLFVAGNRSCGNYNIIVWMNFDLTVIRERHAGQGAHRLALAARGDDNELIGGIAVYHIDIDNYPLGYIEIAELRRDAHDIFEASADERDLASEARRNIHYLLHAVDIGRECCNYYAVVASLAEEGLERFADLSLALGEAGTLGVGRVGHKAEDSSCPISASLPRSIMPPSIGVVSILKSPVWTIVPPSQRIASPSASGMEWLTWIASTVKPPRVITSPGLMTLSDAELSSPCSRSFP